MLIKELCKKCWNTYAESIDNEDSRGILRWDGYNESHWKVGEIYCPSIYLGKGEFNIRDITKDKPPSKCPFYLEYALINQEIK